MEMTELEEYQEFVASTTQHYMDDYHLGYLALGLSGETGEVTERIKKIMRKDARVTEEDVEYIILELGDVLWYVAAICNDLEVTLDYVIEENIQKLNKRYAAKTD